ncbi:MAG: hypothetical protein AAF281_16910 [Pseudomonadota bacterium]
MEWFWTLPWVVGLQGAVDTVRTAMPGASIMLPLFFLLALLVLALLERSGRREGQLPGHFFRGDLTPKTLAKHLITPKSRLPKSRAAHRTALRGAKRRRKP